MSYGLETISGEDFSRRLITICPQVKYGPARDTFCIATSRVTPNIAGSNVNWRQRGGVYGAQSCLERDHICIFHRRPL